MIITGKRRQSIPSKIKLIPPGADIVVAIRLRTEHAASLGILGFSEPHKAGDRVLPSSAAGPVARYNARGRYVVHKDRPKETFIQQRDWHWKEWHGRDTIDRSKIVDIPRKRYPRTFLPPPSIELTIVDDPKGGYLLVADAITQSKEAHELVLHVVNLFLETFGVCEVLSGSLAPIIPRNLRRLNWQLLPAGRHPWADIRAAISGILTEQPAGNRIVIEDRLQHVNKFGPDFVAIGHAGFRGYLVFGFPAKKLFVLESTLPDNATYIFGDSWETLSRLTKAEVIEGNLQKHRLIHKKGWKRLVTDLLR